MDSCKALVLEDDPDLAELLGRVLTSLGLEVAITHRIADARELIRDRSPCLMLVDIDLPDGNGIDLMAELNNETRGRFIVVSGNTSQQSMIKSIRHQAADVVVKPINLDDLKKVISRNIPRQSANDERLAAERSINGPDALVSWVETGDVQPLRDLRTIVSHASTQEQSHVLIEGDHGTDKFSVAKLIHKRSRRSGECLRIDCTSEQDKLASERFFGLEDPSTGECLHKGYLEQAAGGTLVLDDVLELNSVIQARLIAFLESGRFVRVNGIREVRATVSLVAISRNTSRQLLESHRLKPDLYYRLARYRVRVPSLAHCAADLKSIAVYLAEQVGRKYRHHKALSTESIGYVESVSWSGNVLELRNHIEQAYLVASGDELELGAIKKESVISPKNDDVDSMIGLSFWEIERKLLFATLDHFRGNKELTAKTLGISLKTLYNRLNAYE